MRLIGKIAHLGPYPMNKQISANYDNTTTLINTPQHQNNTHIPFFRLQNYTSTDFVLKLLKKSTKTDNF